MAAKHNWTSFHKNAGIEWINWLRSQINPWGRVVCYNENCFVSTSNGLKFCSVIEMFSLCLRSCVNDNQYFTPGKLFTPFVLFVKSIQRCTCCKVGIWIRHLWIMNTISAKCALFSSSLTQTSWVIL